MFLFVHNKRSSFYPTTFQSNLPWYVVKASFTHGSTFSMWRSLQYGKGSSMFGGGLDTKKKKHWIALHTRKVSQMVHFAMCTLILTGVAHWGLMWQNPLFTAHFLALKALNTMRIPENNVRNSAAAELLPRANSTSYNAVTGEPELAPPAF